MTDSKWHDHRYLTSVIDRGQMPADVRLHDPDDVQEENNQLMMGVIKAWEYLKGNPHRNRNDTLEFLEKLLVAYGVRAKFSAGAIKDGRDIRYHETSISPRVARERMGIELRDVKYPVRKVIEVLEDAPTGSLMVDTIVDRLARSGKFRWKRKNRHKEIDYILRSNPNLFVISHWEIRAGGGKINHWRLSWI